MAHRLIKAGGPRALCQEVGVLRTCVCEHVQEKEAVRVELRDGWVLDDLPVVYFGRTPHDELAMEAPLTVHQVEKPVGMLTCLAFLGAV